MYKTNMQELYINIIKLRTILETLGVLSDKPQDDILIPSMSPEFLDICHNKFSISSVKNTISELFLCDMTVIIIYT
jgi:hypothetical protein